MRRSRLTYFFILVLTLLVSAPALAQEALPGLEELDEPPAPTKTEPTEKVEEPKPAMDDGTSPAADPDEVADEEGEEGEVADGEALGEPEENNHPREKEERHVGPMPNAEGSIGNLNTAAAWGGRDNTYRIGLFGWFSSASDVIRFNDTNTWFAGDVLLEGSPVDYFSFNARIRASSNTNTFGRPEAMLSLGDLTLGLKGWYPVSQGVYLGGDLSLFFPSSFGEAGLSPEGMSLRPRFLTSLDIAEMTGEEVFLNIHLNIGYRFDQSESLVPENIAPTRVERFAYGISAYDEVQIGLGFDYQLPYVTPFLEWTLGIPVNAEGDLCQTAALDCVSDAGFAAFPNVLGLGIRGEPIENLGLQLATNIGLTSEDANGLPVTLPYEVNFGVTWTIDPRTKIEYVPKEVTKEVDRTPPQSFIVGRVIDDQSKAGIANAVVTYPLGTDTPQATDADGNFRSYPFAPGSKVKMVVSHPDYESVEVERTLPEEPGEHDLSIPLVPLAKSGTVTGMVEDSEGNPLPNMTVKISGEENATVTTGQDGRFKSEVRAGTYTVAASGEGYLTKGRDAEVRSESTTDLQLVLKPEPKEKLVKLRDDKIEIQQKVFFKKGKADIQERSYGLLDQVAALLAENPQIKLVEIEGHTDDAGSDDFNQKLSQQRADSVRLYLLEQGVGNDRLEAKGYGESKPILPNTSKRNRSINRRVEFQIKTRE